MKVEWWAMMDRLAFWVLLVHSWRGGPLWETSGVSRMTTKANSPIALCSFSPTTYKRRLSIVIQLKVWRPFPPSPYPQLATSLSSFKKTFYQNTVFIFELFSYGHWFLNRTALCQHSVNGKSNFLSFSTYIILMIYFSFIFTSSVCQSVLLPVIYHYTLHVGP